MNFPETGPFLALSAGDGLPALMMGAYKPRTTKEKERMSEMYVVHLESLRRQRHEIFLVSHPVPLQTVIGWGADLLDPEGIERWIVTDCYSKENKEV